MFRNVLVTILMNGNMLLFYTPTIAMHILLGHLTRFIFQSISLTGEIITVSHSKLKILQDEGQCKWEILDLETWFIALLWSNIGRAQDEVKSITKKLIFTNEAWSNAMYTKDLLIELAIFKRL